MKIAVINFSGNVGKSTVARHLLLPRIPGAELIAIESLNADEGQGQALRGRQFGELQEYLQTVSSVVVDIGASNVEELMGQMQRYRGAHGAGAQAAAGHHRHPDRAEPPRCARLAPEAGVQHGRERYCGGPGL